MCVTSVLTLTATEETKRNIWIIHNSKIVHITEGTGDNLLSEDVEKGFIDYIYYEIYSNLNDVYENEEEDGGMVLLTRPYVDLTVDEIVQETINMIDL